MTTTLTRAAVADALDKLIIERGEDFVYSQDELGNCFYTHEDGEPACLVGALIAKLDPQAFETLKTLEPVQDDGNGMLHRDPFGSVNRLIENGYIDVESPQLRKALVSLQAHQDTGGTWGTARSVFIDRLRSEDAFVGTIAV